MKKSVQKRTRFFVGFMLIFLLVLLYLTYYSHVAYLKRLPVVESVMPERTEEYVNGRYLYIIPAQAVWRAEDFNKLFIYTARDYKNVLGQRRLVTAVQVHVKEELDKNRVLVDGMTRSNGE